MPRPSEIAADARALYGPVAARPAAADMGDGALWIDPGAGHALYQVQSGNWVRIGTGTAPPASPAGVGVLRGPYVVDYNMPANGGGTFDHDGAKVDLWTPAVGDVLLRLFCDWQATVHWNSGWLAIGQNVDGVANKNTIAWANATAINGTSPSALDLMTDATPDSNGTDSVPNSWFSSAYVFHTADPLQIEFLHSEGTDPTIGHVEIFALVARPVTP